MTTSRLDHVQYLPHGWRLKHIKHRAKRIKTKQPAATPCSSPTPRGTAKPFRVLHKNGRVWGRLTKKTSIRQKKAGWFEIEQKFDPCLQTQQENTGENRGVFIGLTTLMKMASLAKYSPIVVCWSGYSLTTSVYELRAKNCDARPILSLLQQHGPEESIWTNTNWKMTCGVWRERDRGIFSARTSCTNRKKNTTLADSKISNCLKQRKKQHNLAAPLLAQAFETEKENMVSVEKRIGLTKLFFWFQRQDCDWCLVFPGLCNFDRWYSEGRGEAGLANLFQTTVENGE